MDKLLYSLLIASAIIIIIGSVTIFTIESGQPNSQIKSMLDAVWWTVATISTVGYGDIVPITETGKIMAIFYMLFGISILGIFLSVLGTRFYKRRFQNEEEISHAQKLILDKIDDLEKNQEKLQKDLRNLIDKAERNDH